MIQINCTNCKALLQIDDAFAGGVCRCRHCGTIQTVPKHLKNANGDAESVAAAAATEAVGSGKAAKTLYQKKRSVADPGGAGSGTGLDDLAGIVASSGLASIRLQQKKEKEAATGGTSTPQQKNKVLLIAGAAGGIIALLLGIIIFMAVRDKTDSGTGGGGGGGGGTDAMQTTNTNGGGGTSTNDNSNPPMVVAPKKETPNFLGQPLNERSVAFVLDRGAASQTEGRLDLMKQALLRSLRTLGPDRKFAVVFWYIEGSKPMQYPANGLKAATPENIAELQKFMDDVYAVGQTRMTNALSIACKTGAEAVVLVPVKTFLDENFHPQVMKMRTAAKSSARIYCVSLAQPELAPALKKIATESGGAYRDVPMAEVRAAAGM
jgi:hypothetical protein